MLAKGSAIVRNVYDLGGGSNQVNERSCIPRDLYSLGIDQVNKVM
jgi:hypothetical protein